MNKEQAFKLIDEIQRQLGSVNRNIGQLKQDGRTYEQVELSFNDEWDLSQVLTHLQLLNLRLNPEYKKMVPNPLRSAWQVMNEPHKDETEDGEYHYANGSWFFVKNEPEQ